jgi:hypothetical protein
MQQITTTAGLRAAILELESRQAAEGVLVKEQFLVAYESIKPINLLRSVFTEAAESHDLKENLIKASVGLASDYVSRMLFQNTSNSPFKKILFSAVMFGIKFLIAKNPDTVKALGKGFFDLIKHMFSDKDEEGMFGENRETAVP